MERDGLRAVHVEACLEIEQKNKSIQQMERQCRNDEVLIEELRGQVDSFKKQVLDRYLVQPTTDAEEFSDDNALSSDDSSSPI